jgi:hypothetical protein
MGGAKNLGVLGLELQVAQVLLTLPYSFSQLGLVDAYNLEICCITRENS